jgi:hypothetical protein
MTGNLIEIKRCETADSRTCDWSKVTKDSLFEDSKLHKYDVNRCIMYLVSKLVLAAKNHDHDKLDNIDEFHSNFTTGFEEDSWLKTHYTEERHHLNSHVPDDVNLIDVIEMIADCMAAGAARSGSYRDIELSNEILQSAVKNTAQLLQDVIKIVE